MYERMLDKSMEPDFDDMAVYCGAAEPLFRELTRWVAETCQAQQRIRFPYGKNYGWGVKLEAKKKHLCDLFAEKEACNLMIHLSDARITAVYEVLSPFGRSACDEKYPCGDGGWLHFRIFSPETLADTEKIISARISG